MKRVLTALAMAFTVALFAGCGGDTKTTPAKKDAATTTAPADGKTGGGGEKK